MEELIRAEKLTKIYGTGEVQVRALNGVDLSVRRGEAIAVMGPSGSGKTTLLNMLGALDKPTSGEVFIDGIRISEIPERRLFRVRREKVGFVFQSYYLIPTLTALENVLAPTIPLGADSFREKAEALLRQLGLEKRRHHLPSQLSGGEQQRVAIARALIHEPAVLLADEPTGNLDSKTGDEIVNLLINFNRERGTTLVVVTHEEQIAKRIGRTIRFRDGQVV